MRLGLTSRQPVWSAAGKKSPPEIFGGIFWLCSVDFEQVFLDPSLGWTELSRLPTNQKKSVLPLLLMIAQATLVLYGVPSLMRLAWIQAWRWSLTESYLLMQMLTRSDQGIHALSQICS